jgi:hypothetical protein
MAKEKIAIAKPARSIPEALLKSKMINLPESAIA